MDKNETAMTEHPKRRREEKEIPAVLSEFLRKIVDDNPAIVAVSLVPAHLGWGTVQDIVLESLEQVSTRRVFGFRPVHARLYVKRKGGHCVLVAIV